MKKLLLCLSLATISFASIQAQPVAQDAIYATIYPSYSGDLTPLVQGGTPPYNYALQQIAANNDDMEVIVTEDGKFYSTVPMSFSGNAQFQYIATDSNDNASNTGTITIRFGSEKG